jgi:hypothetical protein
MDNQEVAGAETDADADADADAEPWVLCSKVFLVFS